MGLTAPPDPEQADQSRHGTNHQRTRCSVGPPCEKMSTNDCSDDSCKDCQTQ